MRPLHSWLKRNLLELIRDEEAATALEYALGLALIVLAAVLAYQNFGRDTSDLATRSTQQLPGADKGPPGSS
jgi:Flp pilus assembly pilin Flp